MWVEVKLVLTIVANVFIAIVLSQILFFNMLLGFLLFVGIFLYVFGDIIICYQIKHNHVDKVIDRCPASKEFDIVLTLTGLIDFVWTDKAPHGKREFVYNKHEASFINHGDFPIHTISGNYGAIVHESHDENINLVEAKAAEKIAEDFGSEDIKEIYNLAKNSERGG